MKSRNTNRFVISGISGTLPEAEDVKLFSEKLLAGECLISFDDERWPSGIHGLPSGSAKVRNLDKFDAQFFGISDKVADTFDIGNRWLYEQTYKAICDAGIDPESLRGSNTGYFMGSSTKEIENTMAMDLDIKEDIFGHYASRTAYQFGFTGPCGSFDNLCSSSLLAYFQAYLSLQAKECDQAIVAAINVTLAPQSAMILHRLNVLSVDSNVSLWDENSNGYARGEACVVCLVQRISDAKRVYAEILSSKVGSDGYKKEGFAYPGWSTQRDLITSALNEADIDANQVVYYEAHGTGTQVGDSVEAKAISEAVCKTRTQPLMIGSIKSSIGHAEGASGLTSLLKVIIAYQKHIMPATINHLNPNPNIPQLFDGSLAVCTKPTQFSGGIVGINNFGVFGSNAVLIVGSYDEKHISEKSYEICEPIPRLITVFGRNEQLVEETLKNIITNVDELTQEYLSLLNDISCVSPQSGMNCRGFVILDKSKQCAQKSCVSSINNSSTEIWLVLSGVDYDLLLAAKSLIACEPFAQSVQRSIDFLCANFAENYDSLKKFLFETETNKVSIDWCLIATVIIQIAIIDLLNELNIIPHAIIIGYSVGEIAAGYADGCLTAEHALRIAHTIQTKYFNSQIYRDIAPRLTQISVALPYKEAVKLCNDSVSLVACNRVANSVTLIGYTAAIIPLIKSLQENNILIEANYSAMEMFAHTTLLNALKNSVTDSLNALNITPLKPRSDKWLSSSFDKTQWNSEQCKRPTGQYYAHNLFNAILFHDSLAKAPTNALIMELCENNSFDNYLESISTDTTLNLCRFSLLKQTSDNEKNMIHFLSTIGDLYNTGHSVHIKKLYSSVSYPVPRETEFLSPAIKFDHSVSRWVPRYPEFPFFSRNINTSVYTETVSLANDSYLSDHSIDGRVLYPMAGYLYLAWKTLAISNGYENCEQISVVFNDIRILQATILSSAETVFKCQYMSDSSKFVVTSNDNTCMTGKIAKMANNSEPYEEAIEFNAQSYLESGDFYKEMSVCGYEFGANFQNISLMSFDGTRVRVKWDTKLIAFLDAFIQIAVWSPINRCLRVPTTIDSLRINPYDLYLKRLNKSSLESSDDCYIDVKRDFRSNQVIADGFCMNGLTHQTIPRKIDENNLFLEKYEFVAHNESNAIDCDLKQQINSYCNACDKLATNKMSTVSMRKYCGYGLFDYINEYGSDGNEEDLELTIAEFEDRLDNDFIHSTLTSDRFLSTQVDIVMENINFNGKLSVLEINSGHQLIYGNLMKHFKRLVSAIPLYGINYQLFHTMKSNLSEDILYSSEISITDINFDSIDAAFKGVVCGEKDFIVFRDPRISLSQLDATIDYETLLRSVTETLTTGGFFLAFLRESIQTSEKILCSTKSVDENFTENLNEFIEIAENEGLVVVSRKSDSFTCCSLLFRKVEKRSNNSINEIRITINNESLEWIHQLQQSLKNEELERIWLTSDEPLSGLLGLVKCLCRENHSNKIRCIMYDSAQISLDDALIKAKQTDLVQNVFKNNSYGSFRHTILSDKHEKVKKTSATTTTTTKCAQLRQTKIGDLTSFKWFETNTLSTAEQLNRNKSKQIEVYYCPINFKDVMHATAKLSPFNLMAHMNGDDLVLGHEFVGRVSATRERVMGICLGKGFATDIIVSNDYSFMFSVPNHWSMIEASSVPMVYLTSYYSLIIRGKLVNGETVLIHSGVGGVGQSAIAICLSMGCEVFTTVGSDTKKQWLLNRFPQLIPDMIYSSRDTQFERKIMIKTSGRGVDLVLNSLTDDMFWASVRCLAQSGRFCEIGRYHFEENTEFDTTSLLRNKTFHAISLDLLLTENKSTKIIKEIELLRKLMKTGIESGVVTPLPVTVFNCDEAENALRFIFSGKHIGKVVIKLRDECEETLELPQIFAANIFPNRKSYIITGGLGGIGLELMYWMYERGARNFVLTSRYGVKTNGQQFAINRLRNLNCNIVVRTENASNINGAKVVIEKSQELGPIGGIFLLSVALDDNLFENQTENSFKTMFDSKSNQAIIFDKLLRQLSQPIDYFVCFSSVVSGRGFIGQSNYGMANSILERVCEQRQRNGLNATAIQFGLIKEVVIVTSDDYADIDMELTTGYRKQTIISMLSAIEPFIASSHAVCSSMIVNDMMRKTDAKITALQALASILDISDSIHSIDPNTKLSELGVDSLVATEYGNVLLRHCFNTNISFRDLRNLTIQKIKEIK